MAKPIQRWLSRHGHKVFHPLTGADLETLVRLAAAGPRFTPKGVGRFAFAVFTALGRLPFDLIERATVALAVPPIEDMPPPLFVVGHWRSGTTHVYNVLSRSKALGSVPPLAVGLPWNFLGLGSFLRRRLEECLPEDRVIDDLPVHPDSPQEDELALANMQTLSFYHGIYFPGRIGAEFERGLFLDGCSEAERRRFLDRTGHFMRKLHRLNRGLPLLVKNPAHSARLEDLLDLFPNAKVLHVRRNPFVVVESTRRMLKTLLDTFALERTDAVDLDALILATYPRLLAEIERQTAVLPPGRFHDLAFEAFEADPMREIGRLHEALDLPGFAANQAAFAGYLRSVVDYKKRHHRYEPTRLRATGGALASWIERWDYAPPA